MSTEYVEIIEQQQQMITDLKEIVETQSHTIEQLKSATPPTPKEATAKEMEHLYRR